MTQSISVHRPDFYANRFLTFMTKTILKKNETKYVQLNAEQTVHSADNEETTMPQNI